jgi:hypothetical protein
MALNRFMAAEMVELSDPWVTEGSPANAAIKSKPLMASLLPRMTASHNALLVLQPLAQDPKAKRLGDQARDLDAKHDELVLAIYGSLTAVARVSERSDDLLKLRDKLLPDGASHTIRSYRAEAGHTKLVASRLDAGTQDALKAITLDKTNMLDLVQHWIGVGKDLGQVEAERALLGIPESAPAAEVNAARLDWVRTVNALRAMADMSDLDEPTDHLLFSALRITEKSVARRGKTEVVDPEPTPVDPKAKGSTSAGEASATVGGSTK